MALALCSKPGWCGITITIQDSKGAPIAGVSCSQEGGAPAISDATGKLTVTTSSSIIDSHGFRANPYALSQIPVSLHGSALVTVTNMRGQVVFLRNVSRGDKFNFSGHELGVFLVNVSSPHFSGQGRFVNHGQGMIFEGVSSLSQVAMRKVAGDISITCSKSGFATQSYTFAEGSTQVIDFTLATKGISLFYDQAIPTHVFAASDLNKALLKLGYAVSNKSITDLAGASTATRIVITTMDNPAAKTFLAEAAAAPAPTLMPQGFAIRKEVLGTATNWWVIGADNTGAMYGGLEVTEQINIARGLGSLAPVVQNPAIQYRGVKFNCPFDKRAFSYDDNNDLSQITLKEAWNLEFWKTYFDEMARMRMNQMSVWNKVPWPAMVVTPGFEDVSLDDVMLKDGSIYHPAGINNINDKVNHWKAVMQYAADRGVEFWMMSWNLYLEGTYGSHAFTKGDAASKAYIYASNKQLVKTYPLLRGIGFAEQEAMGGTPISFLAETYAQGIMDGLKEDPNQNRTFGSWIRSDIGSGLDLECAKVAGFTERTSLGHEDKYSGAFMFTTTNPGTNFGKATANHRYWLTTRDDSYVMFRGGGDPEWMREYITKMGDPAKLASINIGGNRVWGMDTAGLTFKNPHELVIQKRWWTALQYGRLGYDPALPQQRFKDILGVKFPEVDAGMLYDAWVLVSRAAIYAHSMRSSAADYGMYFEMCLKQGGFLTIADFLNTASQNEEDFTSISNFVGKTGKAGAMAAPEVIQAILAKSTQALDIMGNMPGSVNSPELQETLADITALALLSRYYGYKLQGALASAQNNPASALISLQEASKAWSAFATWTSAFYMPQIVERASMSALGKSINPKGLDDVNIIQLDVDNEVYAMAGGSAANAPNISAIANQSVSAGVSTGVISVTIGGTANGAAGLTLTATSSNPVLVPVADIVLGGSGANRTVTITPAANKKGKAVITVTASNGTLVKSSSFFLMVN